MSPINEKPDDDNALGLVVDNGSSCDDTDTRSGTIVPDEAEFVPDPNRQRMLIGGYLVFFLRYIVATFLSAFFGPYAGRNGIGDEMQGIIFAVFPIGLTVTAALAPPLILRLGTRMAVFWGMLGTAIFTVLFGFVPDLVDAFNPSDKEREDWLIVGFMITYFVFLSITYAQPCWNRLFTSQFSFRYFMNGLVGGLAETGTTILITNKFVDKIGVVSASIATSCSLGCIAGPPIGGVFYHLPTVYAKQLHLDDNLTQLWAFRGPFIITGIIIFIVSLYILYYFGNVADNAESDEGRSSVYKVLTKSRVVTLLAMALSGTFVATLDPTLANKLDVSPFNMTEPQIGLVFMISSLGQIGLSLPIGWITDLMSKKGNRYASKIDKLVQAGGFYVLALTFTLLGPLKLGSKGFDNMLSDNLNKSVVVWVAMVLKGIGSAGNNAAYPDLAIGVGDSDTRTHATLSGLWNAAYGIGWAAGPLVGGVLVGRYKFGGFATVIALWSFGYAALMTLAAFFILPKKERTAVFEDERAGIYEDERDDEIIQPLLDNGSNDMSTKRMGDEGSIKAFLKGATTDDIVDDDNDRIDIDRLRHSIN